MSQSRIRSLDGFRGIAIILVFLTHGLALPLHPANKFDVVVRTWAHAGWIGADLFFVLSGFLITGILLDTKGHAGWLRSFFVRRALRILPLYFGCLAILLGAAKVFDWTSGPLGLLRANQIWYWTYTVNILGALTHGRGTPPFGGHAWSLSIEEQFYAVWPIVICVLPRRRLLPVAVGVMATGLVFRVWLIAVNPIWNANAAFLATPGRLDALMVGSALAVIARGARGLRSIEVAAMPTLVLSGLVLFWLGIWRHGFENAYRDPAMAIVSYPLIALGWGALLVLALIAPSGRLSRALSGPTLANWARYSYGFYLIHLPLTGVMVCHIHIFGPDAPLFCGSRTPIILVLFATVAFMSYWLAALSYHLYEQRFLTLKRHFALAQRGSDCGDSP